MCGISGLIKGKPTVSLDWNLDDGSIHNEDAYVTDVNPINQEATP